METNVKQKPPNPRKGANIISLATFGYTFGIFLKGYRKELGEDDMTEVLSEHQSDKLGDILEASWENEKSRSADPSLWRVLIGIFGLKVFARGLIILFSEAVLKLLHPLVLSHLIGYYTQNGGVHSNIKQAYLYSGLIVVISLFNVVLIHHNVGEIHELAMKARVACCSLIYRKSLKLSKSALLDTASAQLTNLLSNDVNKFDACFFLINVLWICPIQLVVSACLLYAVLGFTSTIGVFFLALCVPIQVCLAKMSSKLRVKVALKTDQRIRLMNEIISGIQIIKMYTWEKPFSNLVAAIRRDEVDYILSKSYVKATLLCCTYFSRIAVFLSVLTYILTGNVLNTQYVFVTASFYNNIRNCVNVQFPRVISDFAEVQVSIKRLKKFLLMNEIDPGVMLIPDLIVDQKLAEEQDSQVEFRNASASWCQDPSEDAFHDISFKVTNGQMLAIIGPVGSGKSSILHAILKELPLTGGTVKVDGKISYASQEPWLFGASIQQNILFGQELDPQRYAQVIKVCALEQDLSFFPYGDRSLVGERGITLSGGQKARVSLARAVYANADIYLLDDPLSAVDPHVGRQLFEDCITTYLHNKCRILVTHQTHFVQNADHIILVENGKIVVRGTYADIKESNVSFAKYLQINDTEKHDQTPEASTIKENKTLGLPAENKEQMSSGNVSGNIYQKYLTAGSTALQMTFVILLFIITVMAITSSEYFLTYWVNQEQIRAETNDVLLSTSGHLYVYSWLIIFIIFFGLTSTFFFFRCCMRSSITLHNEMFSNIVYAPLRFFSTNPSGRILNRFSKDIGAVDEFLPHVAADCINILVGAVSVVLLICIVNPWLLIPTAIIFFLFYFIKSIFISTSSVIKRLEGTTRSPVFTHINASLLGLTTIRAFGVQRLLQHQFDGLQDVHSSVWYWFITCTRAFAYYLDLFSILYIAIVTFSFFVSPTEFSGNVALAITQALNLTTTLQWGTRQWSEVESYMTSVERVIEYTKIEPENKRLKRALSSTWPQNGKIAFASLSLRYSASDPYVLKKLTFSIEAKEKIGVVGRTGAGKSSMITALFQLANTEGSILIDEVDITQVPFDSFRNKISIIPQEPVLFSGTLRKNLDPFNLHSDEELWNALDDVELKALVSEMPLGLLCLVAEGGANFSVGQRQLLCLARAIIRKNKILVMDEATANVDPQTDTIIQATIRNNFSDCTVITIAHRLNTVIDSDRILVLDSGKVVEFDNPHKLLANQKGMFYSMVQQTGQSSAEALSEIAAMSYKKKENTFKT